MILTLDEAHRDADCAVVSAQMYKQALLLVDAGADMTEADQLIADRQQRVADLTAQQAPPGDVVTYRDTFFQAHRDSMTDAESRLDIIANDPVLGPVLYPDADPVEAAVDLGLVQQHIAALDLVWTP